MLTEPFRGTHAAPRGLVTPGQLREPRFRRLFPDIYVFATSEPDLEFRSRAAALFVHGRGVLGSRTRSRSRRTTDAASTSST